jgi:hypothetical protein
MLGDQSTLRVIGVKWGAYREQVVQAARDWEEFRKQQAITCRCDYDAKRWMGFLFAQAAYGSEICGMFRTAKLLSNRSWWLPRGPAEKPGCEGSYHACPIGTGAKG